MSDAVSRQEDLGADTFSGSEALESSENSVQISAGHGIETSDTMLEAQNLSLDISEEWSLDSNGLWPHERGSQGLRNEFVQWLLNADSQAGPPFENSSWMPGLSAEPDSRESSSRDDDTSQHHQVVSAEVKAPDLADGNGIPSDNEVRQSPETSDSEDMIGDVDELRTEMSSILARKYRNKISRRKRTFRLHCKLEEKALRVEDMHWNAMRGLERWRKQMKDAKRKLRLIKSELRDWKDLQSRLDFERARIAKERERLEDYIVDYDLLY